MTIVELRAIAQAGLRLGLLTKPPTLKPNPGNIRNWERWRKRRAVQRRYRDRRPPRKIKISVRSIDFPDTPEGLAAYHRAYGAAWRAL